MSDCQVMFGLKTVAKYLDVSVGKVRYLFAMGMPYTRDESGMYITTKDQIERWFDKRILNEQKKRK